MTKSEWQAHHGLTNDEMQLIQDCLLTFGGTIVAVHGCHAFPHSDMTLSPTR
jgi:hypothetical protein